MLNPEDSNMAANAICHAAAMSQEAFRQATEGYGTPSAIYKPKLFVDGNQWCALLGDNLQSGVCGFGSTPYHAMAAFDRAWYAPLPDNAAMTGPAGVQVHEPVMQRTTGEKHERNKKMHHLR